MILSTLGFGTFERKRMALLGCLLDASQSPSLFSAKRELHPQNLVCQVTSGPDIVPVVVLKLWALVRLKEPAFTIRAPVYLFPQTTCSS